MKRKLKVEDEVVISTFCRQEGLDSFYHYFPLMYAISESTSPLEIDEDFNIWAGKKELYIEGLAVLKDKVEKVWVSLSKPPMGEWKTELYDVNFIYDLETTLGVKNFRDNVKKFIRDNPNVEYTKNTDQNSALGIIKEWYQKSQRKEFSDFGYTMWLVENFTEFTDLEAREVCINNEMVAFSLWGRISDKLGIHLICKCDDRITYLNDYTRYMTYEEMKAKGLVLCNDGGDCGIHGIRRYKEKLRPKFIIPVYSWIREKGE